MDNRVPGIVKYVIRIFVLHASIAKPLGEGGKLQLTTDMTELEFSLNAFLASGSQSKRGGSLESIGDEYKALRAMRWASSSFPFPFPGPPQRVLMVHADRFCSWKTRFWLLPNAQPALRRSSCSITSSSDHRCHSHTHFMVGKNQSTYAGSMSTRQGRPCRLLIAVSCTGRNEIVTGRTLGRL